MSSSDQLKISMEKHQKQQEAHEKILTEKNEEIEKLNSFCKSLERQVNDRSATEARKTVKKDAELQVRIILKCLLYSCFFKLYFFRMSKIKLKN